MNATVRRELGSDISASCGQLRKKVLDQQWNKEI
jgi:adenine C2-methylase RlmN of 23S rRNA A2503 and tRNA A37